MSEGAAKTGAGPTVMVAIEQHFPAAQPIIHDALAIRILPPSMRAFVWLMKFKKTKAWMDKTTEKSLPGIWSAMMCRKRYIVEKLQETAVHLCARRLSGGGENV